MIRKASFSGLMAALGAVSALAATPQEVETCERKLAEIHRLRAQGQESKAREAEREASVLCVCEAKQDPMISRLGDWPHLG